MALDILEGPHTHGLPCLCSMCLVTWLHIIPRGNLSRKIWSSLWLSFQRALELSYLRFCFMPFAIHFETAYVWVPFGLTLQLQNIATKSGLQYASQKFDNQPQLKTITIFVSNEGLFLSCRECKKTYSNAAARGWNGNENTAGKSSVSTTHFSGALRRRRTYLTTLVVPT